MADESDLTVSGSEQEGNGNGRALLTGISLAAAAALGVSAILYLLLTGKPVEIQQRLESRNCVTSCHTNLKSKFDDKAVHVPFGVERCTACHVKHDQKPSAPKGILDGPSGLVAPAEELCADRCHSETYSLAKKRKYSMPPFKKKKCMSCHEPHASRNDGLVISSVTTIKQLCLSCHPKIARFYKKSRLHPPFAIGICTSCHKPHASDVRPLLRRRPKVLCLSCHQPIAKLAALPTQMEPFTEGRCPQCHNPHGADEDKLLRAAVPDLCFRCHKGIVQLSKRPYQMLPFRQGKCLACHVPHGSPYPKLLLKPLEGNELCFMCHSKYRKNFQGIGHSKVVRNASHYQPEGGVGSCLNCHEPMAANFPRLLQKEQISLCLSCHGPRQYFRHPIGARYDDPWHGGYLRCGSCHNPMGSGIVRLKRRDRDGLCVSCHRRTNPSFLQYSDSPFHFYQAPDSMP